MIGFPIGTRPARYDEVRRYMEAVYTGSPRVTVRPYARSHEGRDLVYAVIGSESRIADLEAVRGAAERWADPRRGTDELPADLPVVAWLGYAIHGDELSSTDAALQVLYQLAAGEDSTTARIRANVLVCIDPSQNPMDASATWRRCRPSPVSSRTPMPRACSTRASGRGVAPTTICSISNNSS